MEGIHRGAAMSNKAISVIANTYSTFPTWLQWLWDLRPLASSLEIGDNIPCFSSRQLESSKSCVYRQSKSQGNSWRILSAKGLGHSNLQLYQEPTTCSCSLRQLFETLLGYFLKKFPKEIIQDSEIDFGTEMLFVAFCIWKSTKYLSIGEY